MRNSESADVDIGERELLKVLVHEDEFQDIGEHEGYVISEQLVTDYAGYDLLMKAIKAEVTREQSIIIYGLFLLCSVLFLLLVAFSSTNLADDSYIFLRFARNIASGYGYVYNVGTPVEGVTSLSWTLLITVFALIGAPLETSARILGLASAMGVLFLLWKFFHKETFPVPIMVALLFLFIAGQEYRISIAKGMETGLYSLLLLALVIALLDMSKRSPVVVGIVGATFFTTRPESILTLTTLLIWVTLYHYDQETRSTTFKVAIIWFLTIAIVTSWRLVSFGEVLPNSVLAKSPGLQILTDSSVLFPRVRSGITYITGWAKSSWPLVILGVAGLLVMLIKNRRQAALFGAAIIPSFLVVLAGGGDWMANHRLLTPLFPLFVILSGIALLSLHAVLDAGLQAWMNVIIVSAGVLACAMTFSSLPSEVASTQPGKQFLACYTKAGTVLSSSLEPGAVVAVEGIGKIGYVLSDTYILDLLGLVDPYIARNGTLPTPTFTYGKVDYRYTMNQRPDLFIFHSSNFFAPLNDLGYSEHYRTFQVIDESCNFLWLGIRNDTLNTLLPSLQHAFEIQSFDTSTIK